MSRRLRLVLSSSLVGVVLAVAAPAVPAAATPVCTDGFREGPPRALCGGRVFPEAAIARAYVQLHDQPETGFNEFEDGIAYLAQLYPRWISVFNLREHFADKTAVSAGPDRRRPYQADDTGDGYDIWVIKLTDHQVPDAGKQTLLFSLSVHGNEGGGREGGLRTAEDLAIAAETGGTIVDGYPNYTSTTGRDPVFHTYYARTLLANQAVYLVAFNPDGWAAGDLFTRTGSPNATGSFTRGNSMGTDLNRQMPTVGRINSNRNPLQESEMLWGHKLMHEVADAGIGGLMAYGADVHGETTSNAYVDIMYPAGEFDSVDHRRLMAIAERTKSVIDVTLFGGSIDHLESLTGGDEAKQPQVTGYFPLKPAAWATVWDTLGYTDTGFIGDYMATDLGVTGMDYEIWLNHSTPGRNWTTYHQENHINATRAIIKTAMAYAMSQEREFNADNVRIPTAGQAGYVANPAVVTDADGNGPGRLPGPGGDGIGQDGLPVPQRPYSATNMAWFSDTSPLLERPFVALQPADIAAGTAALDQLDTLVLADVALPADGLGRPVDPAAYYANLRAWVEGGGNLVLTDRALHALGELGVVPASAVTDITVYQPYTNIRDYSHPLVQGLRANARQLVEATLVGYGIGNNASPMTTVSASAWTGEGGHVVGTTGPGSGGSDDQSRVSVGELALGTGKIRIVGGALPTPTEQNDHRYGLRNYAMTYTGLFIMENALRHERPAAEGSAGGPAGGAAANARPRAAAADATATALLAAVLALGVGVRRRRAWVPGTRW